MLRQRPNLALGRVSVVNSSPHHQALLVWWSPAWMISPTTSSSLSSSLEAGASLRVSTNKLDSSNCWWHWVIQNHWPSSIQDNSHILTGISDQIIWFDTFCRGCILVWEVHEVASFLQDASLHQRGSNAWNHLIRGEVLQNIWYGNRLKVDFPRSFLLQLHFTFQDAEEQNPQVQLPMLGISVSSWIDQIYRQLKLIYWNI